MPLPLLPILIYANPAHSPCPRYIRVYLAEKGIPQTHVTLVPPASDPIPQTHITLAPTASDPSSAQYPPQPPGPGPVLAIKTRESVSPAESEAYTFVHQSRAILEYLEDLCDANPSITPVPSLRGGDDPIERLRIRGALSHVETILALMGTSIMLGNRTLANILHSSSGLHAPSSRAVKVLADRELEHLNLLLAETTDFEGLRSDRVAAANLADITTFVLISSYMQGYGFDLRERYQNIARVLDGFSQRASANTGLPEDGTELEGVVAKFRSGWIEDIW